MHRESADMGAKLFTALRDVYSLLSRQMAETSHGSPKDRLVTEFTVSAEGIAADYDNVAVGERQ